MGGSIAEEEELAQCPTCGALIPIDATVCPNCGQEFEVEEEYIEEEGLEGEEAAGEGGEEAFEEVPAEGEEYAVEEEGEEYVEEAGKELGGEEFVEEIPEEEAVEEEPIEEYVGELEEEEKPQKMFWMGVVLILLGFFGGPIFSYLHDALRIPIGIFTAYEHFGWVNWTVAIVGTVITVIGVVFLVWGYMKIKEWRERMLSLIEAPEPEAETIE